MFYGLNRKFLLLIFYGSLTVNNCIWHFVDDRPELTAPNASWIIDCSLLSLIFYALQSEHYFNLCFTDHRTEIDACSISWTMHGMYCIQRFPDNGWEIVSDAIQTIDYPLCGTDWMNHWNILPTLYWK